MAHLRWLPVLLLSLSVVGGCRGRRFGDDVGESATPSFGDASWRIKEELGGFGLVLSVPDPDRFFYCPSLVLVGAGAGVYGGDLWRFVYQIEKSGWCLDPTFSGGLHPLLGVFFSGMLGLTLPAASVTFFAGEEMAYGHLPRPARSSTSRHAGFPNVLLSVPFQNFEDASSGWWTASVRLLRPPATSTTGSFLQGFVCNSVFFHGCPCKLYDVNYHIFL